MVLLLKSRCPTVVFGPPILGDRFSANIVIWIKASSIFCTQSYNGCYIEYKCNIYFVHFIYKCTDSVAAIYCCQVLFCITICKVDTFHWTLPTGGWTCLHLGVHAIVVWISFIFFDDQLIQEYHHKCVLNLYSSCFSFSLCIVLLWVYLDGIK